MIGTDRENGDAGLQKEFERRSRRFAVKKPETRGTRPGADSSGRFRDGAGQAGAVQGRHRFFRAEISRDDERIAVL